MSLLCYTDGGCRGNPGPGGWAFLLIDPRTTKALERAGGERQTTNNRMEMTGAIRALESLRKDNTPIAIHTDSKYLVDCCTNWMPGWKRRGWKRKDGPLKNVDLLKRLDELMARHPITWHWVKGHAGVRGNEHVDALLNAAMDRLAAGGDPAGERSFRWKGALP
ncbi:MAG: ribonuclease HI [Planctomycetota bacterium]